MKNVRYELHSRVFFEDFDERTRPIQHLLKLLTGKSVRNIICRLNRFAAQTGATLLLAYGPKAEDAKDKFREEILIGMGALIVMPQLSGVKARIEDVVVDDAYRGQGIGEKIVRRLIARARKEGAESVELTSAPHRTAANALYRKLGFEQRETNVYRMELKPRRTHTSK